VINYNVNKKALIRRKCCHYARKATAIILKLKIVIDRLLVKFDYLCLLYSFVAKMN